jgi:hypothetical protein
MGMPKSSISVGWGVRAESVDACADRVAQLVLALANLDPALTGWRDGGTSIRDAAAKAIVDPSDHADLVQRLQDGRIRGDLEREVIEPLGHTLFWWNGAEDNRAAVNLKIHIGASELGNSLVLNLPYPDAVPSLYSFDTAHALLHKLIGLFHPDSIVWSSGYLRDKQREPDRPTADGRGVISGDVIGQAAGWANYFGDSHPVTFDPELLPSSATVETLDGGTLLLVGQNPAEPPLGDVLQVRKAMGYQVHA